MHPCSIGCCIDLSIGGAHAAPFRHDPEHLWSACRITMCTILLKLKQNQLRVVTFCRADWFAPTDRKLLLASAGESNGKVN
jgi:hypothetical protein